MKICAVPDCGKTLWSRSTQGVCREHNHATGYCTCNQCAGGSRRGRIYSAKAGNLSAAIQNMTPLELRRHRMERSAEDLLESVLNRTRWTANDRDRIASWLDAFFAKEAKFGKDKANG